MSTRQRIVETNEPWASILEKLKAPVWVPIVLLLVWYYGPLGVESVLGEESIAAGQPFVFAWKGGVSVLALLLLPMLFKTPLRSVGFAKPALIDAKALASFTLLSGGVFALVGLGLLGAIEYFPEWFEDLTKGTTTIERVYSLAAINSDSTLVIVMMVLGLPIMEELFFRGLLYPHLRREFGVKLAVVFSALIFAFAHNHSFPISQLIGGFFFAMAFERTGRLWVPIALHMLGNGTLYWISTQMADALNA